MRLLIVTPTLGPGGAERLVITYAEGLRRRGLDVMVCYGYGQALRPLLEPTGVRSRRLSDRELGFRTLGEWRTALARVVREFRPDAIYAQSVTAALVSRLVAPRLPLLVTIHGIAEHDERRAAAILRAVGARVTAVSEAAAVGIMRHAGAPPVELIVPGIDIPRLEQAATEATAVPTRLGDPAFLCVARQHPAKGVDVLLRSFVHVLGELPEARLTVLGGGYELTENRALADGLGIAPRVRFTGLLTNAAPFVRAADVLVLPSRREGLPVLLLEAFVLGCPVVATAVGGVPTLVKDGETGRLVPPEDERALAAAMVEAARRPDEGARMAEAGGRLVRSSYSAETRVDRIEELLVEVVRGADSRLALPPRPYHQAARALARRQAARVRREGQRPWRGVRIFGYHRVVDAPDDVLSVTPDAFAEHMARLAASDVEPVSLTRALDLLDAGRVTGRYACVTFDDAYRDNLEHAVPVLERLGIPATIFAPTAIVDGQASYHWYRSPPPALGWSELRALADGGLVDVQAHTRTHPRLPRTSLRQARAEIVAGKAELEQRLGRPVTTLAYPAGQVGPREVALVEAAGYRAGLTTEPGVNDATTPRPLLRRTMIYWGDRAEEFEARLHGGFDTSPRLRSWLHARRVRG